MMHGVIVNPDDRRRARKLLHERLDAARLQLGAARSVDPVTPASAAALHDATLKVETLLSLYRPLIGDET